MKVFVIILEGKPHVFASKSVLDKVLEGKEPRPPVHVCEVEKRTYVRKGS